MRFTRGSRGFHMGFTRGSLGVHTGFVHMEFSKGFTQSYTVHYRTYLPGEIKIRTEFRT